VQLVIVPLGRPITQFDVFAVAFRNIAVPVDFAIVGSFKRSSQRRRSVPFEIKPSMPGFEVVISDASFLLGATCIALLCLTPIPAGVFCSGRNIAVPVDFAKVGKLAVVFRMILEIITIVIVQLCFDW
jgi:hypothetical protein